MARIRTIKPDFFRHGDLYDAEKETGLPLRVAFAGLWTAADREGRFEWDPRELKLDCLPHDEVDFSRVLDALATRGFIVRYASGTRVFGHIPSWKKHQIVNHRESASILPAPPVTPDESTTSTRESRVGDASTTREGHARGEGKGREGNGESTRTHAIAIGPPEHHRGPRRHGASLMPGVGANVAAVVPLDDTGRVLEIPESWARRVRNDRALSHADVDEFARWLGSQLRAAGGVVEDGGNRFRWLDERVAAWRASTTPASDGYVDGRIWLEEQARLAKEIPDRTPERVRELLGGPPRRPPVQPLRVRG